MPRLNILGPVMFLLDTGADRTCLNGKDTNRLKVPKQSLSNPFHIRGIGGEVNYYDEPTQLFFQSGNNIAEYIIDIAIADDDTEWQPSLLGRDIFNRWDIRYNYGDNILQCEVHSADGIL